MLLLNLISYHTHMKNLGNEIFQHSISVECHPFAGKQFLLHTMGACSQLNHSEIDKEALKYLNTNLIHNNLASYLIFLQPLHAPIKMETKLQVIRHAETKNPDHTTTV